MDVPEYTWVDQDRPQTSFSDVPETHPYHQAILYLRQMDYLIGDGFGHFYPEAYMSAGTARDLIQLITQTQIPEPEHPKFSLTGGQLSQMLTDGFGFEASLEIDGQYLTRAQTAGFIWQALVDQYLNLMNLVTEVQDPAAIYELVYYAHMIPRSVWLDFDRNGYRVVYDDDRLNKFTVSFVKGLYSLGKKTVYVRVGYPFVLLHEMGHHVYYDYDINWILGPVFEKERANAVSIMRPYTGNNKADFFADCYMFYISNQQNPDAIQVLATSCPETYQILQGLPT